MGRLSKQLHALTNKVVFERHQVEAKAEAHQLRQMVERLLLRGATEAELLAVLNHDHWQHKFAVLECSNHQSTEVPPWIA